MKKGLGALSTERETMLEEVVVVAGDDEDDVDDDQEQLPPRRCNATAMSAPPLTLCSSSLLRLPLPLDHHVCK